MSDPHQTKTELIPKMARFLDDVLCRSRCFCRSLNDTLVDPWHDLNFCNIHKKNWFIIFHWLALSLNSYFSRTLYACVKHCGYSGIYPRRLVSTEFTCLQSAFCCTFRHLSSVQKSVGGFTLQRFAPGGEFFFPVSFVVNCFVKLWNLVSSCSCKKPQGEIEAVVVNV